MTVSGTLRHQGIHRESRGKSARSGCAVFERSRLRNSAFDDMWRSSSAGSDRRGCAQCSLTDRKRWVRQHIRGRPSDRARAATGTVGSIAHSGFGTRPGPPRMDDGPFRRGRRPVEWSPVHKDVGLEQLQRLATVAVANGPKWRTGASSGGAAHGRAVVKSAVAVPAAGRRDRRPSRSVPGIS